MISARSKRSGDFLRETEALDNHKGTVHGQGVPREQTLLVLRTIKARYFDAATCCCCHQSSKHICDHSVFVKLPTVAMYSFLIVHLDGVHECISLPQCENCRHGTPIVMGSPVATKYRLDCLGCL